MRGIDPWWKKNINLKFSRMMTVFSTVAALAVPEVRCRQDFEPNFARLPIERLAATLDGLDDASLLTRFSTFLDDYETFLQWKEDQAFDAKTKDEDFKLAMRENGRSSK
jgi:hypothetical protein